MAGTLWPESAESQALYNLRQCLSNLRQALGSQAHRLLSPAPHTLSLDLAGAMVDVVEFDREIGRGDLASLEAAVALYRGPLLEGCSEEWVLPERQIRVQAYLHALEQLSELALQTGDPATAVDYMRRAVGVDPLRESAQRGLMQALAAAGDYLEAAHAYREFRLLLDRELRAQPSSQTNALYRQIRTQSHTHAVVSAGYSSNELPDRRLAILPRSLTPLIGRQVELQEIRARLASERLVTLTGTGGVGKTRLALAVVEAASADYPHGVCFVELAALKASNQTSPSSTPLLPYSPSQQGDGGGGEALNDPFSVVQAMAQSLGVHEQPGRSLTESLLTFLQPKTLLLALDNCEHLLAECASLVQRLLQGCPQLRVLATSRQALGLMGEAVYRVSSLSTPEIQMLQSEGKDRMALLMEYEAPQLFVARAAQAEPDFGVSGEEALTIGQICARLEGIPLAIELAASRVRVLTLEQIATRLEDHLHLLAGGSRTAPLRHQTLRATLDWSYDLLTPAEQVLLARLSVFSGDFTLEAAEFVCTSKDEGGRRKDEWNRIHPSSFRLHPSEVLDLLTSLIDKSLVQLERREAGARYRLLEIVRQYAAEKLKESGEAESVRELHCAYYLRLAETAEPQLTGPEQAEWLDRLEVERDNLRTALEWSLKAGERGKEQGEREEERAEQSTIDNRQSAIASDPAVQSKIQNPKSKMSLRLAGALWRFWWMHGYLSEGRAYLTRALESDEAAERTPIRAKALHGAAVMVRRLGDEETASKLLEESLSIWQEVGDDQGIARSLLEQGLIVYDRGDVEAAKTLYLQSLGICKAIGDKQGISSALHHLGWIAFHQLEYETARAALEESLAIRRELGDRQDIADSLIALGSAVRAQGDHEAARELLEESLLISRAIGNRYNIAASLHNLGNVASEQGEYEAARALFEESLAIKRELGDIRGIAHSLFDLGNIAATQGDAEAASELLEESLSIRRELGDLPGVIAWLLYLLGNVTNDLGDYAASQGFHEQSLAIRRQIGDVKAIPYSLYRLGNVAREQGDLESARALYQHSLAMLRELNHERGIAFILEEFAYRAVSEGQRERAVRLWSAADVLRAVSGSPMPPREWKRYERETAVARSALGEGAFVSLSEQGRAMTLEQTIDYALDM